MKRCYLPRLSSASLRLEALVAGPDDLMLNRCTASQEEHQKPGFVELLPYVVTPPEEQINRGSTQYEETEDDLRKNIFLSALQASSDILSCRLFFKHIYEMLPIVYDPTIACILERYSHQYWRPQGVYLLIDHPEEMETVQWNVEAEAEEIDLSIATDAEEILTRTRLRGCLIHAQCERCIP